jgi:hypothetical protein
MLLGIFKKIVKLQNFDPSGQAGRSHVSTLSFNKTDNNVESTLHIGQVGS